MPQKHKHGWAVNIIESERGWGQKVDETCIFGPSEKHRKEALAFVQKFNAKNDKPTAPDWYEYATEPFWKEAKDAR